MNKQEIVTVLKELHKISGFRVSLHGADFHEIAAFPERLSPFCSMVNCDADEHSRCLECDKLACHKALSEKSTYIYKCRYGLTEAVSPLYNFGSLTGFLMMGQVAESESEAERAVGLAKKFISEKPDVTVVSPEMIGSFVKIMTICAEYLTLSNSVIGEKRTVAEEARRYIEENLEKKFCIADICKRVGCSKSTLLTTFKREFGTTVNNFVNDQRLKKAEGLLYKGKLSVAEISSECGFSDQSYFSKVFSARYGIPPTEYRAKRDL